MNGPVRRTVPIYPDPLRIALGRVKETLAEAEGYPMSHVWSFRIADIRDLVAALGVSGTSAPAPRHSGASGSRGSRF